MLTSRDGQQDFFDHYIFSRMIPEDHPLVQIKKHVDFSFVTEVVADLYDPVNGRPSYPPESLFRVLFLEIWAGLSDIQVCRELKYNVLYRWFCDFGWDDEVTDDTTLVVFRKQWEKTSSVSFSIALLQKLKLRSASAATGRSLMGPR